VTPRGRPRDLQHGDGDRHDPLPPPLSPEGGGLRRDDDGVADERGGADRREVAARAIEEDKDPGEVVDPDWMP
jgi:hypothetical protein